MISEQQVGHRMLLSARHQDIGALYLGYAVIAAAVGVVLTLLMRSEFATPGMQVFGDAHSFNLLVAGYGLVMALFVITPALLGGFASWFVPTMIGAGALAFPRLHSLSFWLLPVALTLLVLALFLTGDAAVSPTGLALGALCLAGLSAILAAINFITTILNMRAPGMSLHRMPLYVWSILITSALMLLWLPVLGGAVTMLVGEHAALLVEPASGGVNRYAFWFLVHPEVYVLLLPSFGIISQIIATFSKRPVTGHLVLAYAMVAIGFGGFIAWAQQLYGGAVQNGKTYFIIDSIVIALLACISILAWLVTLWRGARSFRTPVLWALGFVFLLTAGALTGVVRADAGLAAPNSHAVLVHFQYVLALGAVFAIFANWFYWFPKFSGLLYNEALAKLQFWVTFVGVNLAVFTQHFLGLVVTLRRIVGDPNADAGWQQLAAVGTSLTIAGLALFVVCMAEALLRRDVANQNPWLATTREWTTP